MSYSNVAVHIQYGLHCGPGGQFNLHKKSRASFWGQNSGHLGQVLPVSRSLPLPANRPIFNLTSRVNFRAKIHVNWIDPQGSNSQGKNLTLKLASYWVSYMDVPAPERLPPPRRWCTSPGRGTARTGTGFESRSGPTNGTLHLMSMSSCLNF